MSCKFFENVGCAFAVVVGDLILVLLATFSLLVSFRPGALIPNKRLMRMCCWKGLHFYNRIDYNGVTFLVELLEWGRTFSGFLG